jgi:hypothetical protein
MQRLLKSRSLCLQFGMALLVLICTSQVSAWSTNQKAFHGQAARKQPATMYTPPSPPASQNQQPITAQKMLKNPGTPRVMESSRKSKSKLSQSVLASCDTLPSFPTAHGLLSPETVMRLEELTSRGHRSEALVGFLKNYRKHGPLSCIPMLSDPDVLPHLTEAMRDIA